MYTSVSQHLDIFIPQRFNACLPICLFSMCNDVNKHNCFINCTYATRFNTSKLFSVCRIIKDFNRERNQKFRSCLGVIFNEGTFVNDILREVRSFGIPTFILEVGDDSKKVTLLNWGHARTQDLVINSSIISYDSEKLYSSELLTTELGESFIDFLFETCKKSKSVVERFQQMHSFTDLQFCQHPARFIYIREKFIHYLITILTILCSICTWWTKRIPKVLQRILNVTTTGKQIACKSYHLQTILQDLYRSRKFTLLSGNLLSALVMDAVFGLLVTYCCREYIRPVALVEAVIEQTDVVVSQLQHLLYWLMGVPAGLKLNLPLNSALGKFFLYHIYLWKTYIELIKPFLLVMLELSMHFGILGLSFLISLCTDLFSLATLHIYCFYGYAARIYSLKLSGLIAFWRLFRGKKWNPLRKRVDSYTYDVQQLFLGTLIFTVLVFLLPTVALYYTVFSVLRLFVLLLQVILCKMIDILTAFPMYVILLCLLNHPLVKGDVYLKVVSSGPNISLSLEVISLPISTVILKTLPLKQFYVLLGTKDIINKIIFGKIIFPL